MSFNVMYGDNNNAMEAMSKQQDAYLYLMMQQQQQQSFDLVQSLDMLQWTQQYPTPPSSSCLLCTNSLYLPLLPPPAQAIPLPSHTISFQPFTYVPLSPTAATLDTPEDLALPPAITLTPPSTLHPTTTTLTLANAEECAALACFFWFEPSKTIATAMRSTSSTSSCLRRPANTTTKPTLEFISFCRTLITSTRITHDITLLSLLYIHRARQHHPRTKRKPGSEWRQLVAAFILANKYLDDNTYTNKTWADLTGYDLATIHALERTLLTSLSWNLHISHHDYTAWQDCILRLRV